MRIVISSLYHLSQYLGGAEVYADQIATSLAKKHQVHYLTSSPVPSKKFPYQIHSYPQKFLLKHSLPSYSLYKTITRLKPQIYHAVGSGLQHHLPIFLNKTQYKSVFSFLAPIHPKSTFTTLIGLAEQRLIQSQYDRISILTQEQINFFQSPYHQKITVLSPTLPTNYLSSPKKNKSAVKQLLNLDPDTSYLLHVSKLDSHHYYKGTKDIILSAQHLSDKYHYLIIGTGNLQHHYQDLSRSLKLDNKISFLGQISDQDMPFYFQASDICLQPSTTDSEGFGIVVIESLSQRTPVITTHQIGQASILKDAVQFVPPKNPQALAAAVLNFPNFSDREIQRGRSYALSYSSKHFAQQIEKLYVNLSV
jgi:glycosyltransferase involved in cell wall biosynthesis